MSSIFLLLATSFVVAGAFKFSDLWHQGQNNYDHNTNNDLFDLRRSETPNCTERAVQQEVMLCAMPLRDIAIALSRGEFDAVETREELDATCQLLHGFKDCVGGLNDTCGDVVNQLATICEVTYNGVNFFCSDESKTVFLDEINCWKKPELKMVVETCAKIVEKTSKDPCKGFEPFMMCLHCSVDLLCNVRAADYLVTFIHHTYGSLVNKICPSQSRQSRGVMDTFLFQAW